MKSFKILTLEEFETKLDTDWEEYQLVGQVKAIKEMISKTTGKPYQLVVFADKTSSKTLMNCTKFSLQLYSKYKVNIRACKQNQYSYNAFVQQFEVNDVREEYNPVLDYSKSWFNQVVSLKNLAVKDIKPLENTLYPLEDEEELPKDLLVNLIDDQSNEYFCRVWANDESVDRDQLVTGSVWSFENVIVSKTVNGAGNITKKPFSNVYCVA